MKAQIRLDIIVRTLELLRGEVERAVDEGRMDDAIRLERQLEDDWHKLGMSAARYWLTEGRLKKA